MSTGRGFLTYLGLKTATSWGSVVTAADFVELNSESIKVDDRKGHSASLYSINTNLNKMYRAGIDVGGDFSVDVRYEGLETLLYHALGAKASAQQGGTAAWKHTLTIADALPLGLSLEIYREGLATDVSYWVDSCKINTLGLSIDTEGVLVATFGTIGRDLITGAKSSNSLVTAGFSTKDLVIFSGGAVTWGVVTKSVKNFSLTLNNSLTPRHFIGSRYTLEPYRNGKIEVTGNFVVEFDGAAEYNDFRNAQERALVLTFTGDTIEAPYTYQFVISCNVAVLGDAQANISAPGPIELPISFKSYLSGDNKELKIEITNTLTSVS